MTEYSDVEPDVLAHLRAICLALPDAYEEQAWTGRRWLVRRKTFAHVLAIEDASPRPRPERSATPAPSPS